MRTSTLLAISGYVSSTLATQGFNYGSLSTTGAANNQVDFQALFSTAKNLAGTSGSFSSARLYTTIQAGTVNDPISAIPAAIAESTTLLLGMWASSGQMTINNEIQALKTAINKYGTSFTNLVTGISVGSEDLYRITPTALMNDPKNVGAGPSTLVSYINQVRDAISTTSLSQVPIGHVDTWTGWVNGSNADVIKAVDWIGMNTFPYFQAFDGNGIENGAALFKEAYTATQGVSGGKSVWVTETGWPVSGQTSANAVANVQNAKTYWDQVGCPLFGNKNTWWYTLFDSTSSPSFGIVGPTLSTNPLFDLTCSASSSALMSQVSESRTATEAAQPSPSAGESVNIQSSTPGSSGDAGATATGAASSGGPSRSTGTHTTTGTISGSSRSPQDVTGIASVQPLMGGAFIAVVAAMFAAA
ncbi:hypothetical protein B7494_g5947 [Chlorociboria aeruginascens]|nr:hypothetical protein B7494_g5947 [Chlorociboria aeruginascens]